MGFFDKLKENVGKAVDVDKLKEMAGKTVDSVKQEVAKAMDPTIKEQERLEKERIAKEQEEAKRKEKERAISEFFSSIDLDQELEYIFDILQKSKVTASNFEKGVEHMLSKMETTITSGELLPALKKELVVRAFSGSETAGVATVIITDYFVKNVVDYGLVSAYIPFAVSRGGDRASYSYDAFAALQEHPFIQTLYGVAGRAASYHNNKVEKGIYSPMTAEDFIDVIENSSVLKSYTDKDPFAANEEREKWAQELYNAPLEVVKKGKMGDILEEEEYVDALYYFAYVTVCEEDPLEDVCIDKIATAYLEHLKKCYSSINR